MTNMTNKDEEKKVVSSKTAPDFRSALRWYMLGFALLGAAVGFFAGSSRTPVIGILLPLLFGLIGGAGGLYLARVDLDEAKAVARLRVLGKVLTLFIIFSLIGSVYGISLRTGRSIRSFLSLRMILPENEISLPASALKDPEKAVKLAMLRARIRALGVSLREEQDIVQRTAQLMEGADYSANASASLSRLATLCNRSKEALRQALQADQDKTLRQRPIGQLDAWLFLYAKDYEELAKRIANNERISVAEVSHKINGLRNRIERALYDPYASIATWLLEHDSARRQIWELQWALIDEKQNLEALGWIEGGPLMEAVDRFLSILYSRGATNGETTPLELPQLGMAE